MHIRKDAIAYMVQITLRTPADIGALIKDRRRALGLDQAELAERIGVGRLWVNQVEGGKPGASMGLVLRALAAVGVDLKAVGEGESVQQSTYPPVVSPDINAIVENARRKIQP
jgi:HTH-type transcriptional regulator / antitoxin HipB